MHILDIVVTLQWWGYLFVIGLIFFPLVRKIFSGFVDFGYPFAKTIGIVVVSYIVFLLGTAHIAPFTQLTIFIVCFACAAGVTFFLLKNPFKEKIAFSSYILMAIEEILFLSGLLFWAHVRAYQPDIFGLEKYMDFGFVNSILRSTYFPPRDMWYTPLPINYYYFGHLVTAVLTKLSGIPSPISFNLMLATLFGCTYTLSFSLAGNLWRKFFLPAGLIGGFLVTLGGNLQAIYSFFTAYPNDTPVPFWQLLFSPKTFPNNYWYPNATRFIYHTIHEFPSYSFVVSDLHGHVLDIPVVLTTIAFLLTIFMRTQETNKRRILDIVLLSFFLAVMYMTNAWDGMIYFLLTTIVIFVKKKYILPTIYYMLPIFACFLVLTLPFSLFFNPGALVGGIGLICAPQFLISIGKIGPFIFEPNHCMHSPLWQLLILYGFFIFWFLSLLYIFIRKSRERTTLETFALILSLMAFFLIVLPEFFYLRDIYTTYFRANTMFKLVYQAFILFSLATSFAIMRFLYLLKKITVWRKLFLLPYLFIGGIFFGIIGIYPYFAITSYYANLKEYKGLDGTAYLAKTSSSDALGILWLDTHIKGQPVILEAQGDSYTQYARVSANTGLPTVLGWPVHEWLWRGTYDIVPPRVSDIQTMYETKDPQIFLGLAQKYHVAYIFVGQLERTKYLTLNENKFKKIARVVFSEGATTIYQVSSLQE